MRVVVGAVAICLFAVFGFRSAAAQEALKVGYSAALTGDYATSGEVGLKALKLALNKINKSGGIHGKPLELVVVDNQSTPKGAVNSVKEILEKNNVQFLIGPLYSAQISACLPIIVKNKIPTATGATATRLTIESNRTVFRFRPDDGISAFAMVRFLANEMKVKKIGVLHDSGAFGVGGSIEVNKLAESENISVVKRVQFDVGVPLAKHKEQLEELKKSGAEAVLSYVASYEDQGNIAIAWQQMGRSLILMGTPMILSKPAMQLAKESANGVISVADGIMSETPGGREFSKAYKAEYGADADPLFSWTYDAFTVFANALKATKSAKPAETIEAIFRSERYEGIYGSVKFDHFGNGVHQASIVKVEDGTPKLLKIISK